MKQLLPVYISLLIALLLLTGCPPEIQGPDVPDPTPGELVLDSYVALGDGFTAGVANADVIGRGGAVGNTYYEGGLYAQAQSYAYPNLLAKQLAQVAPPEFGFVQAEVNATGWGNWALQVLQQASCNDLRGLPRLNWNGAPPQLPLPEVDPSLIDNRALPGLSVSRLNLGVSPSDIYGWWLFDENEQPYRGLFDSLRPEGLFTLWLGNEDLLRYAYLGGEAEGLVDSVEFGMQYRSVLEELLKEEEAYGLVLNLPNPLRFPFFSVLPKLHRAATQNCDADTLYIMDSQFQFRPATDDDYILLTAYNDVMPPNTRGSILFDPVMAKYVVDMTEARLLRQYWRAYNRQISQIVTELKAAYGADRLMMVDMEALYQRVDDGIVYNGQTLSGGYLQDFYTLDGIFLTPRGNALVANELIEALEAFRPGTRIPKLELSDYPGVPLR